MGILWTIIIGFVAGLIAKFLHPGPNEPSGFIVTTLLGIAGAFLATFLGQAIGWRRRRIDRSNCRRNHSVGGVGDVRQPQCTKGLISLVAIGSRQLRSASRYADPP
jgi:uncharacterized membrane protein YeaQ/YmgE (transglycosylase-associated protein family)